MRILGIDPGYAIIGYGIIEPQGHQLVPIVYNHIATAAGESFYVRLKQIMEQYRALLRTYEPQVLAIEKLFFSKNTKTAMDVAQVRGVLIAEALDMHMEIFEYTPGEVKLAVSGYGQADKQQVQKMVKSLLGLPTIPKPDDTADALAVAICYNQSQRINRLARGAF